MPRLPLALIGCVGSVALAGGSAFAFLRPEAAGSQDGRGEVAPSVETYACLDSAARVVVVTGHHESKFGAEAASDVAFDARRADFLVRGRWGTIVIEGDAEGAGVCWAGGRVYSDKRWDASWSDHKDLDGPTRNSAAFNNAAHDLVVTGLYFFNVHDGLRGSDGHRWVLQHSWGEYVRDDCVENDHQHSGRVYDTLLDGCYTGVSTRPGDEERSTGDVGQVVELDRVLLRMEPMPYPYEWRDKRGVIRDDGRPYDGQGIPYGHGDIFKIRKDPVWNNPHFRITNSVFVATHATVPDKLSFPPDELVDACADNTIVWLGPGSYPGTLPTARFPDCFTILTGKAGQERWVSAVTDWHARHPDVGAERKPASPGDVAIPRRFRGRGD